MSKFIISGFYDEVSSSLTTQFGLIKELGEKYICPRTINGKNISSYTLETFNKEVLPELKQNNIEISTMGSPYGKININDEEKFCNQLLKLEETVKICKAIGCKYIRIFSFFMPKGEDYAKYHKDVIKKLRQMLVKVEGSDIILLHENEKHIYGDEPNRCIALYKELNHPNFKLIYDPSNYIQCGYDPINAYNLTKEYTVEYHIKDCAATKVEVPLGMGEAHYSEILSDLDKRGYEGFLTLEPHTAKYAKAKIPLYLLPFMGFALKGWRKTFRFIDKALNKGAFTKVSEREVFVIQYHNLKNMLGNIK